MAHNGNRYKILFWHEGYVSTLSNMLTLNWITLKVSMYIKIFIQVFCLSTGLFIAEQTHHTTTWVTWRGRTATNSFLRTEFYRVVSRYFLQSTQQAGRKSPVFLTRHHLETISGEVPCLREHGLTRDWTPDNDFTVRHANC